MSKQRRPAQVRATVRIDAYRVISDAVERGAGYAWTSRIFKYTDKPSDEGAINEIVTAVLSALGEVLSFDQKGC
jgi:hypothetical protein